MASLRELQLNWSRAVLTDAAAIITPALVEAALPAARRLNVYRNHYLESLRAALACEFPVVLALVGEDFFALLAREYVRDRPPRAGSLRGYGGGFADWLAASPRIHALPYLSDVARLEWARQEAYHAAEHPPLDRARLAAVAPEDVEDLVFTLHPSCRLLRSGYPLLRIWQAAQPGCDGEPVSLDEGGGAVLVARPGERVFMSPLSAGAQRLLAGCEAGERFGDACAGALAAEPGFDLNRALQQFVVEGVIAGFHFPRI